MSGPVSPPAGYSARSPGPACLCSAGARVRLESGWCCQGTGWCAGSESVPAPGTGQTSARWRWRAETAGAGLPWTRPRTASVMTGSSWWSALPATGSVAVSSHRPTFSGQGTNTAILFTTAVPVTRTSSSPGTRTPQSQSAPRQSVGRREFYGRSVSVVRQ